MVEFICCLNVLIIALFYYSCSFLVGFQLVSLLVAMFLPLVFLLLVLGFVVLEPKVFSKLPPQGSGKAFICSALLRSHLWDSTGYVIFILLNRRSPPSFQSIHQLDKSNKTNISPTIHTQEHKKKLKMWKHHKD